jgi:phage/conjugal plasmid C-4 type zinc finger TraR family protein
MPSGGIVGRRRNTGRNVLFKESRMDVFDQATELERLDRESALVRARAAVDRGGPEWIDGVACCRECGEPIPQKRLDALPGVGLCRACQEERENGGR